MSQIVSEYQKEIQEIESWWKTDRQKHLKRPYPSSKVASIRNSINLQYPSSIQGNKLWKILNKHKLEKTPIFTFGCVDPAMASQMSKADLEIVYVSGGVSALQIAEENGRDHADYPSDTVPKLASRLFKSQLFHDRRQKSYYLGLSEDERNKVKLNDYLLPMIADGDMGFGGVTSIMKETKMFVEAGTAMVHYDDLAIGLKKFTEKIGRTVVPTSEYLRRLTAARFQMDIMGSEMLLMSRVDCYHADFITSVIDPRDHKYIKGVTNSKAKPFIKVANETKAKGEDINAARVKYFEDAKVMVFTDAVKEVASNDEYDKFITKFNSKQFPSILEMKQYAKETVSETVFFDWELPRTSNGQYLYQTCNQAVIERAIAAMPITDTTWARMDTPKWKDIVEVHEALLKVNPTRCFGFGFTGGYNYHAAGFTDDTIESFPTDLAKMGIVFQVQPIFALQGVNRFVCEFGKMFQSEGIKGYIKNIQLPSIQGGHDHSGSPWSGAFLADEFLNMADSMDDSIPY